MTIEHKTTHGPNQPGHLAADWMLETGHPGWDLIVGRTEVSGGVRLAVRAIDRTLTPESAAALRDALVVHLRNIGWDDPDTQPAPPVVVEFHPGGDPVKAAEAIAHALRDSRGKRIQDPAAHGVIPLPDHLQPAPNQPEVIQVAESIRDAYADNSRTIGPRDVSGVTDAEAHDIGDLKRNGLGVWEDSQGILYTDGAALELRTKARHERERLEAAMDTIEPAEEDLASPVNKAPNGADIFRNTVRGWTDQECRGAWNHAMEDTPKPGRLTDRPSQREYTPLAGIELRDRLNKINRADADRG